jgi:hypothetical protein
MTSVSPSEKNRSIDRGLQPVFANEIEKLKLQANIVLGDFIFNTIDEYGIVWVITDIEGWWRHPSAELPEVARGYGDGSYDVQGRYASRQININGVFLTPDPTLVEAARDRLVAATNLVYKGAWLKTGNNPIRASWVRLSGDTEINTINARGRTEFSIGLRAADPIKYSWNDTEPDGYDIVEIPCKNTSVSGSGTGVVVNIGNYGVPCYLEVVGPVVSPASIYNRTTDQLLLLTQGLKGSSSRSVVNKQLAFDTTTLKDIATLTTSAAHQFKVGDTVYVDGVGEGFDGERILKTIPTDTTFTFDGDAATVFNVAWKALNGGVATIETADNHTFSSGQRVTISGVDSLFDGDYTVASTPTAKTLTFSKTRVPPRTVTAKVLISNIATLTTSDDHQFIVGETVTITGVDVNFNGSYIITAIPNSTQFSYAATRTNARGVINKSMSGDVVTLTTSAPHGFVPNESVNITGVDLSLNGGYTILDTPTLTTFSYRRPRATVKDVSIKALATNVATITTSTPHGFEVGEKVTIADVDSTFNGTYTITSLPSNTTFTYAKTASDLISTSTTGTVRASSRTIKSRQLVGNVVTVTTKNTHGIIIGEQVTISGIDATFNGTYTVESIPSSTTFTYAKTASNVTLADAPANSFVEMTGTISSTGVVPDGLATVAGSLPASSASGTASVSSTIDRLPASGKAIKKNDVQFTPGLSGATAVLQADILEIDTKNREVAFNGEVEGARGRVDVLADFIELAPGNNTIEFEDAGSAESTATLRVYYRSGWLG